MAQPNEPKPDQDKPVTDTVDKPETANPAPESTPAPVAPSAGEDVISDLQARVGTLEGMVTALVSSGGDSTPVKKPWTHRSLFGGRD
jgi:hypothetical protein